MASPRQVHVLPLVVTREGNADRIETVLSMRCTVCGTVSELFGRNDSAVQLSELDDWAAQHECPRMVAPG